MKNISIALKNHLAQQETTVCTLWKITRQDGTVFGYTDLSRDVVYESLKYEASSGHRPSNIKTSNGLNVDNLEVTANLGGVSKSITDRIISNTLTDKDVFSGLWDYATVEIKLVNYNDLSMGDLELRKGTLGEIKTGRTQFIAELRGLMQNYQQSIGREYTASCSTNFGSAKCGKVISDFTFNGTVNSVINQHSWIDNSLNQTQATIQKAIQNIAAGTTTIIQANAHGFSSGSQVSFSGITGSMSCLNGFTGTVTFISANVFSINFDSSIYLQIQAGSNPLVYLNTSYSNNFNTTFDGANFNTNGGAYIGGGLATLAVTSEFFQGGLVTWLTGLNAGLKMEVKSYRPNYVFIAQQMGSEIKIGDTYKISAGCDLQASTCHNRFNNIARFRGFNIVPGQDALISGKG